MRVVSLLPSATEILFAVGAGDDVVAVTHECDFPAAATELPSVTADLLPPGLTSAEIDAAVAAGVRDEHTIYRLEEEALRALEPDVIVTQSLCGVCAVPTTTVEAAVCAMPRAARVLSTDPHTLAEVLGSIEDVGRAVGRDDAAASLVADLRGRLDAVRAAVAGRTRPRVLVLEWPDPPYAPGHWVPDMVEAAGGECVVGTSGQPSVRTTWDEVAATEPDVVVLAFCGFGLDEQWKRFADVPAGVLPAEAKVVALDASAVASRPGPRLVDGVEQLAEALHRVRVG